MCSLSGYEPVCIHGQPLAPDVIRGWLLFVSFAGTDESIGREQSLREGSTLRYAVLTRWV